MKAKIKDGFKTLSCLKMTKYQISVLSLFIFTNILIGQSIIDQRNPSPPPNPIHPVSEEVYRFVEPMPRFPGCEDINGTDRDKEDCANKKMKRFIQSHLKYPKKAKKEGIIGIVKASFVIGKAGEVTDEKIKEGLTKECNEEVLRVLSLMRSKNLKFTTRSPRHRSLKVLKEVEFKFTGTMMASGH